MAEVVRANLPPANAPRPRLVARILAERPATAFKTLAYRLKKAILSEDRAEIKKAASAMTSDERMKALEQFEQADNIAKGYWTGHDYSGTEPRGVWSRTNPRPPQGGGAAMPGEPARGVPAGPAIIPAQGTGPLRSIARGDIGWFEHEGVRRHAKVLKWGAKGVQAADDQGDVYAVTWQDWRPGVHKDSEREHEEKVARREYARSAAMRALLQDAPVEERERIGKSMGLDL